MQLPSVQLDAVVQDPADYHVANRNPQPGEVQIPLRARIEFDVFEATFDDLNEIEIEVDDLDVYEEGIAADGWTVDVTEIPFGGGLHFVLTRDAPFENGQTVRVGVEAIDQEEYWVFTTYDVLPPLVASVVPINKDQLRVTFNELVQPAGASKAKNYYIERISRPAATPRVQQVEIVSPTEVLLTTSFELSFGAAYQLVINDVQDEFDNWFLAPNNTFEFVGFLPPFPAGRRWLLHDFVPRIALSVDNGDLILFLGCLQDTSNLLLHAIDRWLEIIDPDTAPEEFVDAMLVDLGNPFDFPLTLQQKRRLAKVLVTIYQLKGTEPGIVQVVRFFVGVEVTVETFVDRGWRIGVHQLSTRLQIAPNPAIIGPDIHGLYCFRVRTNAILTEEQEQWVRTIAIYMKGAQEHFIGVRDGKPRPPKPYWWAIGKSQLNYSHLWNPAGGDPNPNPGPTPQPQLPTITSFRLSDD